MVLKYARTDASAKTDMQRMHLAIVFQKCNAWFAPETKFQKWLLVRALVTRDVTGMNVSHQQSLTHMQNHI